MARVLVFLAILALDSSSTLASRARVESASPMGKGGPGATCTPGRPQFCQMPDPSGSAYTSQIDSAYPFDSGVVDDYVADFSCYVYAMEWWGQYWNYPVTPGTVDYYVVTFYLDDGNCYPGSMVSMQNVSVFTETYEPVNDWYHVTASITPVDLLAGRRYWVEIQGCMVFKEEGLWGWQTCIEEGGDCGGPLQGFPLLGIPYWTEREAVGVAFCLYTWGWIAVDESSVSAVKSLY